MAKNTNRVATAIAYVAALGLATGAFAAHWEMYVNNPVTYASEVFGGDDPGAGGVTLAADDGDTTDVNEGTHVVLGIYLPNDGTAAADGVNRIEDESEVEVTLTLSGGTFGQAINWTDINIVAPDGGTSLEKVGGSQEAGRRGDAHVTLKVMVPSGGTSITVEEDSNAGDDDFMKSALDTGYGVSFNVGSIQGYTGTGTVSASASFRVTDGPAQNFPTETAARMAEAAVPEGPGPDGDILNTGDNTPAVPAVIGTSSVIANSADALTFDAADGGTAGQINLDNRASFDGMTTKIQVASFSYTTNDDAMEEDGKTSFAMVKGTKANIMVTVTGMVRSGDTIWFDQDGDSMMGSREQLSIAGGNATRTFRIDNVDDPMGTPVYFSPNGTDDMTDGSITASFAVEYDDEDAATPDAESGMVSLEYAGIDMHARAYAIPGPDLDDTGMTDMGNVRIRCHAEGDSECTVFLDCNEQDGTRHFEELGSTIEAGATKVETSASIAGILAAGDTGLTGGTWTGRLSCDVFSDEEVSVQVLVRNRTGHPLINNTYVD